MAAISISQLLRRIADAIETMTEEELNRFLAALPSGKRSTKSSARVPLNADKIRNFSSAQLQAIVHQLEQASTREEGAKFLYELNLSRSDLATIARVRNVHVTKYDNVPRIIEKLVETVIGSRLNSRAIRGLEQSID
jgi:hypothetical protein